MGQYLKADINSITNLSTVIRESTDIIASTLEKMKRKTEEMDTFFNTPTGRNVKETMLQFFNNMKLENDELLIYSEKIKNASALYNKTMKTISDNLER